MQELKQYQDADFFQPTGDMEADLNKIREFYAGKKGLVPANS